MFAVQRAACSGSGPFEGTGWNLGLSLCLMLGHTHVWLRTARDKLKRTTLSQCMVKRNPISKISLRNIESDIHSQFLIYLHHPDSVVMVLILVWASKVKM